MTSVQVPNKIADAVLAACEAAGRPAIGFGGGDTRTLIFTPDLTATEQSQLDDIITACGTNLSLTLAEWRAIKSDVAGLKQYIGLSSPTAAQTVAATKAIIRVLGAILRS